GPRGRHQAAQHQPRRLPPDHDRAAALPAHRRPGAHRGDRGPCRQRVPARRDGACDPRDRRPTPPRGGGLRGDGAGGAPRPGAANPAHLQHRHGVDRGTFVARRRHRDHEHHAGERLRANARDRHPARDRSFETRCPRPVPDRDRARLPGRRGDRHLARLRDGGGHHHVRRVGDRLLALERRARVRDGGHGGPRLRPLPRPPGGRAPPGAGPPLRMSRPAAGGNPGRRAGDVLSARAGLSEVRWALVGAAPRRAVRGALQGLLQDGAELRACRLRRVKLKPGRKLTVHYDAWVRAGGTEIKRPVVAVWDRGDGRIDRDPRAAALEAQAVGGGTRAVRPLGALADDGVILFPAVAGRPLSTLLRLRDHGVSRHLQQAARALRTLHSAPAALAEAVAAPDFAAEVEGVARASEHICTLLPRTGAVITATLERARAVHDRLPREVPTFTHGDFKADHVWVSRGGLTLLDFGSCGIGDPARDVGKFLADLRWWSAVSGRGSASAGAAFRAAYGAEGSEARLLRAHVYEALFLLVVAAHRVPLYHP